MIDQPTIDRILDAANIVDVVSEFVTLRKRGINYVGLCPFHSDKSPSFYVSPAKNICKCFACGEGGTAVHFIMKHEQLSYYDALRFLAKKYNIEIQERELSEREKQVRSDRESMLIVNSWAQKYFTTQLYEHQEGKAAGLRYFAERGFREDTIRKFQLGYSLDQRDALYKAATKSGYKKEFLEKGYTDASLRAIEAAADASTNSIYVRFGDKEGLFSSIVEPALHEMLERFIKIQEQFHQMTLEK